MPFIRDDSEKAAIRSSRNEIVQALSDAGVGHWRGDSCRCPFHDDKHASAGIFVGDDKAWRFKCQACHVAGDVFDIKARTQRVPVGDLLKTIPGRQSSYTARQGVPAPKTTKIPNQPSGLEYGSMAALLEAQRPKGLVAHYAYSNPETKAVELLVMRFEPEGGGKYFKQASPGPDGKWSLKGLSVNPIYNRTRVAAAGKVIVCEGEKCVHAITAVVGPEIAATTSPGGAANAGKADWSPLAGKAVYVFPDHDAVDPKTGLRSGTEYGKAVVRKLEALSPKPTIYWIHSDKLGLPIKGDVVEYLVAAGDEIERKRNAIEVLMMPSDIVSPLGDENALARHVGLIAAGKLSEYSFPWQTVGSITHALRPGMVTLVCGDPGDGKSFWILQCALHWHRSAIPFCLIELEDDRPFHLMRAAAQYCGEPGLTNFDWIKSHSQEAGEQIDYSKEFVESFGNNLIVFEEVATHETVIDAIRTRLVAGDKIVAIDPITACVGEGKPWEADQKFLQTVKKLLLEHKASLVVVTHPREGSHKGFSLDNLAGGRAWSRFSQTVLWIRRLESEERNVQRFGIHERMTVNRSVSVMKARNGTGAGVNLAYYFDHRDLLFAELGVLLPEDRPQRRNTYTAVAKQYGPARAPTANATSSQSSTASFQAFGSMSSEDF